jgi:predicted DNA-binding transcriptional regulator AlpA
MVLLTVDEIANLIGLSRRHVTDKITKRPDFPRPVINVSSHTKRWALTDVKRWAQGKKR